MDPYHISDEQAYDSRQSDGCYDTRIFVCNVQITTFEQMVSTDH